MFAKILVIILAFGAIGCVLLVNRQNQIEIAHEMSRLHERVAEQERTVWRLRAEIAQRCSPDELRRTRERLEFKWIPFVRESAGEHATSPPGLAPRAHAGDEANRSPAAEDLGG